LGNNGAKKNSINIKRDRFWVNNAHAIDVICPKNLVFTIIPREKNKIPQAI